MKNLSLTITTLLTSMTLTGCQAFEQIDKNNNTIENEFEYGKKLTYSLHKQPATNVKTHNKPWVASKSIRISTQRIPTQSNCHLTFATSTPITLNEFSKTINKLCGIPVRITPDAEQKVNGSLGAQLNDSHFKPIATTQNNYVDVRWEGKLEGLFDNVASSLGLSWRYSKGEINFYYLDSRTFDVYAIPSQTQMQSSVQSGIDAGISGNTQGNGGDDSGVSSYGQSSQSTLVSLSSDMTTDIRASIESMLTPNVGRLSAAASTGKVTVTDIPAVLDRIKEYIDSENKSITKQVLLNVKVLSVTLNDSDQFGIDWSAIYNSGKFGSSFISSAAGVTGNALSTNILDGNFKDSKLLIDALSKQGKVSIVTSPSVTTLNLQPVPVQVATQTSYLARVESNNTANVGTSVTLTPGTVTSGFNMNLLPFVMPENKLLLQYAINLSELKGIKEVRSSNSEDGNRIQVPEVDNRIFSQKVKLSSGQTLILSGFEQTSTSSERSGFGDIFNWFLGGGVNTSKQRTVIVIIISPIIME